jgi:putative N6-adenine-specific DNA methylase
VAFAGDQGFMYKANLNLRTALRVLRPLKTFTVKNEAQLYDQVRRIDWSAYLDVAGTLAVDTVLSSDLFTHSQFLSLKAKDAIVDQFREAYGQRPSVDLDRPDLRINLLIQGDACTVSLDSSGDSLHKRGYRDQTNLAPSTRCWPPGWCCSAAGTGVRPFIDPMCGSGTILIEAGLLACNIRRATTARSSASSGGRISTPTCGIRSTTFR